MHVRKVYEEDTGGEDTVRAGGRTRGPIVTKLITHPGIDGILLTYPAATKPTRLSQQQVRDEILARHELPIPTSGPAAHPPARLAWHPTYDFVLAVAAGPTIYFINVPPTADVAAAPEYAAPVAAARSADGATLITNVAFSPDGGLLAAGDAAGYVSVWALTADQLDPALIQPLAPEPDIRFQAYEEAAGSASGGSAGSADGGAAAGEGAAAGAVVSLQWLTRGGGAAAAGANGAEGGAAAAADAAGPRVLLTGDGVNAHVKLWAVDLSSKPTCTHALRLVSAAGGGAAAFFNHLETQPLYDCVVLANELRSHVCVLHVDLGAGGAAAGVSDGGASPSAAAVAAGAHFDYCTEFNLAMPVLSATLVPEVFVDEATEADAFHMYTIQGEAVQQYTLVPQLCFPCAPASGEAAAADGAGGAADHGHHAHAPASSSTSHGRGHTADGGAAGSSVLTPVVRDPLAALLAGHAAGVGAVPKPKEVEPSVAATAVVAAVPPAPAPTPATGTGTTVTPATSAPAPLVGMPSDVSDATSPPAAADAAPRVAVSAPAAPGKAAAAPEVSPLGGRASLLLTPSQLMQSAAAAAAARSATTSSAGAGPSSGSAPPAPAVPPPAAPSPPAPSAATVALLGAAGFGSAGGAAAAAAAAAAADDGYSIMTTAGGDNESVGMTSSLPTPSAMTPVLSDANLSATAAAAEEAEVAAEAEAEAEASAAEALAAVAALPTQAPPTSMPPLPSAQLVRKVSQVRGWFPVLASGLRRFCMPYAAFVLVSTVRKLIRWASLARVCLGSRARRTSSCLGSSPARATPCAR
mgnify:CR=1 FL=1